MHKDQRLVLLPQLSDFDVKSDLVEAAEDMSVFSDEVQECLREIVSLASS